MPSLPALTILLVSVGVLVTAAAAAPFYPDKANLMVVLDDQGRDRPVATIADWQVRRGHILANMQLVMGEMPLESRRVPLDVQTLETVETPRFTRLKITFAAEPGDRVPAYLLLPKGRTGKLPAVLCLHQTTGIGKSEPAGLGGLDNLHYAQELAERGTVTLAPDYPGYGDYQIDPYALGYVSATMKGIWNHRRALDLLQSRPEVDPERLGCIGHSLGGHNTLFLAAFDERVKVAVTSCGFNSFAKYMGGNLSGWSHAGYMPRIKELYQCNPAEMPFDFTEILGAIAPRAVFVNAPTGDSNFDLGGVQDCLNAAMPVYALYGAGDRLVAQHPDGGHDFPLAVRQAAYEFIDRNLKP
jgi:dienelactone hydrolase